MKRADFNPPGGRAFPAHAPRASESQTRIASRNIDETELARGRTPAAPTAERADEVPRAPAAERAATRRPISDEEPRTGVVRRFELVSSPRSPAGAASQAGTRPAPPEGTRRSPSGSKPAVPARPDRGSREWRCLEWGAGEAPRRPARDPRVTVAQLTAEGELVRQSGPDAWLGEAGEFMHRMAALVAQGLGHSRCRALCLKGPSAVVSVSEGNGRVVASSGPPSTMGNALRRAGLE